jgi:acylpyruvate hydrolase
MRFITFKNTYHSYRLGVLLENGKVVDINYAYENLLFCRSYKNSKTLADTIVPSNLVECLHNGTHAEQAIDETLADIVSSEYSEYGSNGKKLVHKYEELQFGPPVVNPGKIICLSQNYHDAIIEAGNQIPPNPLIFSKYNNSLCGNGDTVTKPIETKALGYEAELALVIGKSGRNVQPTRAMEYVAGYMIMNDITAHDLAKIDKYNLRAKTYNNFAPCGPWFITRDEIEDPHDLEIKLWVNDKLLQDSNSSEMVYKIPDLISFISEIVSLEQGDIIATGSPAGIAKNYKPPAYLNKGDICTIEIEGLGRLENTIS